MLIINNVLVVLFLRLIYVGCTICKLSPCRYNGDLKSSGSYEFGKLLFVENSDIFFSVMNVIYMNNLCNPRHSYRVMEWKTPYYTFKITSALKIPLLPCDRNYTYQQESIYFVCGVNKIRQYTLLSSNIIHFEELGMICSFWRKEEPGSKHQPHSWIQLNNPPFNKQTLHPGLIAASRLGLLPNYISSTDVETGYSLVVANAYHEIVSDFMGPHIYAFGPKDQPSTEFKNAEKLRQQQKAHHCNHQSTSGKEKMNDAKGSFGWRSNAYSKLWFGENVQFLSITNVNSKYFYIIFTEQDISAPYTAYEGSLSEIGSTVTRIGRVCQRDPGSKLPPSILPNGGGVFTTFRKTRLVCRAYSSKNFDNSEIYQQNQEKHYENDDNKNKHLHEYKIAKDKSYIEFNRAIAVSKIVPTADKTDHVFYALMTTTDSISGLYGLCAFNLNSVDENLDVDHLIKIRQTNNAKNGLSRMVWRVNNKNETTSSIYHSYYHKYTLKWTVDVVPQSKMTKEIMETSKTCPTQSLPNYYSQFATLHPLVGTSVWALNTISLLENQKADQNIIIKQPGKALKTFTMIDLNSEVTITSLNELPVDFTVQWANSIHDKTDVIFIVTNEGKIFTIETGIKLKQQIVHSRNFKSEINSNIYNIMNYFIKTNVSQKFQLMDKFKIIDNNYTIQSLYKCSTSNMLSVMVKLSQSNAHVRRYMDMNEWNRRTFIPNKMIYFHPDKVICETYFACKNCHLTNKHFCNWTYVNHSCLMNESLYSQLMSMNSNLYQFCNDYIYANQPEHYQLHEFFNESRNSHSSLSKRQIEKLKFPGEKLSLMKVLKSTPALLNNITTMKYNNKDKFMNDKSHNHSIQNATDYSYKSLHSHVFSGILFVSILIICIPLSMIGGYIVGNKDYLKQYTMYNKVKHIVNRHLYRHYQSQSQNTSFSSTTLFTPSTFHEPYSPYFDLFNYQREMFHFNCNDYHPRHHYCQKYLQKTCDRKNYANNKRNLMNLNYHSNNINSNTTISNNVAKCISQNALEKRYTTMHDYFYYNHYNDVQPNETVNETILKYTQTERKHHSTKPTTIHLYNHPTNKYVNDIDGGIKSKHSTSQQIAVVSRRNDNIQCNRSMPNAMTVSPLTLATLSISSRTSVISTTAPAGAAVMTDTLYPTTTTITAQVTSASTSTQSW
ncbi:hypothetical protein MN116_002867 [Schistosoma mekongi]|uniref:Sema domain-containing protein n=1 Tax=Schistosoma mekongi TaxID=38744 RepID=A0AAE1ZHJ1_SCHME|nr:hypothetical protein MN116_002867 [Schistosoma mekongi]